jgi:hypothetical protein
MENNNTLSSKLLGSPETLIKLKDKKDLGMLLGIREFDGLTALTYIKKDLCFPKKKFYLKLTNIFIYLFLTVFITISFLIHYKFINPFISVKWQVVSLFLIASILPLTIIFFLGFHYLSNSIENSKIEAFKTVAL